ncbi:alpha-ketoacid dehydrogenase subunit beta [soil metagenome]
MSSSSSAPSAPSAPAAEAASSPPAEAASITYLEAIREAQAHALASDPSVFLYGQDIGAFGGAFKATKKLSEEFPGRVLDAPISEDAMVGLAIGAAIDGLRPVIEMQFADFSSVGFNQIINQMAAHYWRTDVSLPITIRLPSGGTFGSGPFHSQSMEGLYAQYPGLVVVAPATVADAYHMLIESIALEDPVIFCEHKFLYYHLKSPGIPNDALPIGKARIIRSGRHATVVAYSAMVHEALRAAEELEQDGFAIEVVDLRSVKPIDMDTVLGSVARTGRLLAVSEAFPWGGTTSEVVSRVVADGFNLLDAPPRRLTSRDTPIPYHPSLWKAHRPTAQSIAAALRDLLAF